MGNLLKLLVILELMEFEEVDVKRNRVRFVMNFES